MLSRLACYPQPLLRSLFFHPTIVFDPNVKTLAQILTSVRAAIDAAAATADGFDTMVGRGWRYMQSRERRAVALNRHQQPPLANSASALALESLGFAQAEQDNSSEDASDSADRKSSGLLNASTGSGQRVK